MGWTHILKLEGGWSWTCDVKHHLGNSLTTKIINSVFTFCFFMSFQQHLSLLAHEWTVISDNWAISPATEQTHSELRLKALGKACKWTLSWRFVCQKVIFIRSNFTFSVIAIQRTCNPFTAFLLFIVYINKTIDAYIRCKRKHLIWVFQWKLNSWDLGWISQGKGTFRKISLLAFPLILLYSKDYSELTSLELSPDLIHSLFSETHRKSGLRD